MVLSNENQSETDDCCADALMGCVSLRTEKTQLYQDKAEVETWRHNAVNDVVDSDHNAVRLSAATHSYNTISIRTHRSLNKDAPISRPIQRADISTIYKA